MSLPFLARLSNAWDVLRDRTPRVPDDTMKIRVEVDAEDARRTIASIRTEAERAIEALADFYSTLRRRDWEQEHS